MCATVFYGPLCVLLHNGAVNTSAAVNQHATTGEAVFSVGPPRSYITRITGQLELELSSGIGSCSRELRESPELAE
jgi:hypothetical protein